MKDRPKAGVGLHCWAAMYVTECGIHIEYIVGGNHEECYAYAKKEAANYGGRVDDFDWVLVPTNLNSNENIHNLVTK